MKAAKRGAKVAGAVLAAACLACGSGTDSDQGNTGDTGNTGNTGSNTLELNAALGVDVIPALASADEAPNASGLIELKKGDEEVAGATVTLNGVTVPAWNIGTGPTAGVYSVDQVKTAYPGMTAGGTLQLAAHLGSDSASLSLPCPDDVTISLNRTSAAPGEKVTLSWTGKIAYDIPGAIIKPTAQVRGYDPGGKTFGFAQPTNVPTNASSIELTVPDVQGSQTEFVVELRIPGNWVDDKTHHGVGLCALVKRVELAMEAQP